MKRNSPITAITASSDSDSDDKKTSMKSVELKRDKMGNPKPTKKAKTKSSQSNGDWTADKRALFLDTIIANGYKATDLGDLGARLGLGKKQLINQLTPGRKGSLRDKAVQAVRAEK